MPYWKWLNNPKCKLGPGYLPEWFYVPHADGINVIYANTHAKYAAFRNSQTTQPCYEDWWADHGWEGYHE